MHGAGIFIFSKIWCAIHIHWSNSDPFIPGIVQSDRLEEDCSLWCYNKMLAANALKYDTFFFYLRNFHKAKFLHRNFLLSYSISTLIFDVCHLECCFIWTPEERYMDIYSKPECSVFACIPSSYMSNTSNTTTNGVNLGRDYLFDWPTGGRSARGTCLKTVIITAILQL